MSHMLNLSNQKANKRPSTDFGTKLNYIRYQYLKNGHRNLKKYKSTASLKRFRHQLSIDTSKFSIKADNIPQIINSDKKIIEESLQNQEILSPQKSIIDKLMIEDQKQSVNQQSQINELKSQIQQLDQVPVPITISNIQEELPIIELKDKTENIFAQNDFLQRKSQEQQTSHYTKDSNMSLNDLQPISQRKNEQDSITSQKDIGCAGQSSQQQFFIKKRQAQKQKSTVKQFNKKDGSLKQKKKQQFDKLNLKNLKHTNKHGEKPNKLLLRFKKKA